MNRQERESANLEILAEAGPGPRPALGGESTDRHALCVAGGNQRAGAVLKGNCEHPALPLFPSESDK